MNKHPNTVLFPSLAVALAVGVLALTTSIGQSQIQIPPSTIFPRQSEMWTVRIGDPGGSLTGSGPWRWDFQVQVDSQGRLPVLTHIFTDSGQVINGISTATLFKNGSVVFRQHPAIDASGDPSGRPPNGPHWPGIVLTPGTYQIGIGGDYGVPPAPGLILASGYWARP